MYRNRNDPRLRRTLDELSHNIESANEAAQEGIYAFSHNYINPCVASVSQCFEACAAPCFGSREDRLLRRRRGRGRARAEHYFDFYDDWEEEENDDPFAWGNSEFDRLLAGQGSSTQPGRQRAMSYGARRGDARHPAPRRKSAAPPHDGSPDPTIIPTSSYFGFLGRLPFRLGGKGLRYKPSAADLQDHPGASRRSLEEHDPLIEEAEEFPAYLAHRRQRSGTNESGVTSDSLSSRGDILPSEDELDDAVPLDDEFAVALERRNTATFLDDTSSGKTPHSRRPRGSRTSTRTVSSKGTRDSRRRSTATSPSVDKRSEAGIQEVPTLSELKFEEVRVQKEEEENIERRRDAARALAVRRGLKTDEDMAQYMPSETKSPIGSPKRKAAMSEIRSAPDSPPRSPRLGGTIPFPSFDSHPTSLATSPTSHAHGFGGSIPIRPTKEDNEGFVPAKLPNFGARLD